MNYFTTTKQTSIVLIKKSVETYTQSESVHDASVIPHKCKKVDYPA